jgi:hypothetical protein
MAALHAMAALPAVAVTATGLAAAGKPRAGFTAVAGSGTRTRVGGVAAVSQRGADQGLDARAGHRAADQEALAVAAAHLPQHLQLHRILDALRDHLDAQVPADLHDRAGQQGHGVIVP